jgi:uncharacterized phage protein gp47/JayE
MAGGVAQGVGPEFKSQYHTHKKTMTAIHQFFQNLLYELTPGGFILGSRLRAAATGEITVLGLTDAPWPLLWVSQL